MGFIEGLSLSEYQGVSFLLKKLKFCRYKQPTGNVRKKIYCEFYVDGINLDIYWEFKLTRRKGEI